MIGKRKIRIECAHRAPQFRVWRVGYILETGARSPVGAGCSMLRDKHGRGTGHALDCGVQRCRKHVEVTFATWRKLVAGLDEAGVDVLDIAALPF